MTKPNNNLFFLLALVFSWLAPPTLASDPAPALPEHK